jgi:hypothetical protein
MAKVTLRKAAKYRSAVEKAISELSFKTSVAIPVLATVDRVESYRDRELDVLTANLSTAARLDSILLDIRTRIGRENSHSGLDDVIAEKASAEAKLARLERLFGRLRPFDGDTFYAQVAQARAKAANPDTAPYADSEISACILNDEDVEGFADQIISLKRMVASTVDAIAELNALRSIDLSDASIDFLTKNRVI